MWASMMILSMPWSRSASIFGCSTSASAWLPPLDGLMVMSPVLVMLPSDGVVAPITPRVSPPTSTVP